MAGQRQIFPIAAIVGRGVYVDPVRKISEVSDVG